MRILCDIFAETGFVRGHLDFAGKRNISALSKLPMHNITEIENNQHREKGCLLPLVNFVVFFQKKLTVLF